jgi:hypothetical protein
MRLVILGGVPSINQGTAASFVLAHFAKALSQNGHEVTILVEDISTVSSKTITFLDKYGIRLVASPRMRKFDIHNSSSLVKKVFILLRITLPFITNKKKVIKFIKSVKADHYILFWDSVFEVLINDIVGAGLRISASLANSPQSAERYNLSLKPRGIKQIISTLYWAGQEKKYNERLSKLDVITSHHAVDAIKLKIINPNSFYLSNTWPDRYSEQWRVRKEKLYSSIDGTGVKVLLNMGGVNQTGNSIARKYFLQSLVPVMISNKTSGFEFNICGGGTIDNKILNEFKTFEYKTKNIVNIKGFVDNIDDEIMQNHLFLLLNNIDDKYNASYTRVIQCAAVGSTLIAHFNLSKNIPELEHKFNCLLFNDVEELQMILMNFAGLANEYFKLGENLRKTYEANFHPQVIAHNFVDLLPESNKSYQNESN